MNNTQKSYLALHISVLLWGFTAILGKVIDLPAFVIVWWRVLITSASLIVLLVTVNALREIRKLPQKDVLILMGIGVLVGIHWVAFYGAIKLSNASICLVCMATTSFFTAVLEPIILKQRLKWYELALGILIIPGMLLIVKDLEITMVWGVLAALAAAFLAALFTSLNKKYVTNAKPMQITFLELGSAFLFLSLLMPFYINFATENIQDIVPPSNWDWIYLVVLSLVCTTLPFILSLFALRYLSAFVSALTVNLEPVYGILLAIPLLHENQDLSLSFYLGTFVILLSVFSYPFLKKRIEVE